MKFGRMKTGPKKQIPTKIKFQPGRRGRPGRPAGWRKPFTQEYHRDEQMDTSDNTPVEENSFNQDDSATNNEETDNSMAGGIAHMTSILSQAFLNWSFDFSRNILLPTVSKELLQHQPPQAS